MRISNAIRAAITGASLLTAITARAADELDEVVVTGSREANASINGLQIDPLQLPQSVRLLDEELVARTGITDLSQLFDFAGGMARQNSFGGAWDAYAVRGFSGDINQGPDLLVNRFTANRGFNPRRDVATVQSFQVVKGPASALSGKGEPGGSINIVTKAPRDEFHSAMEVSLGSDDLQRASLDIGGPAGAFGWRGVAAWQQTDGFRDFVGSERLTLAPSFSWKASDQLRLLYQLEFNDVDFVHDRGVVAINGDGKALPRERFLGEPNDGDIQQRTLQHQLTATLDLTEGVALEAGLQYRDGSFEGQSTHNATLVGTTLRRQLRIHDYDWDDLQGRLELAMNGELAGFTQQLRFGVDAFTYDQRRIFFRFSPSAATPYGIDVLNPVYGQPKPVAPLNQDLLEELQGQSVYVQDLITLSPRVNLLLGLRHDRVQQRNTNYRNNVVTRQSPSRTTPRAALNFTISDQYSMFASWGRSFRYNQGVDVASNPFAPELGKAWELGAKYSLLGGTLTGTAALFHIDKGNILVNDPANGGFQIEAGEARSRGFEFDLNWQLTDAVSVTAVYALTDTKITEDTRAELLGSALSNVPQQSAAAYAFWRSRGGEVGSFSVGGGVIFVDRRNGDDVNSGFKLPHYVTTRLNLGWRATEHVSVHVDAENLFDTYYLESSYSNLWITPGTGRTVKARVQMEF